MPRLIWSANALQDLARLHSFLKSRNTEAANRAIKAIRHGVRLLAIHPEAGRPIENMSSEFREWLIEFGSSGYIARYRYEKDVVLLAIRHAKEDRYFQ